jgi:hypothetical protein
MASGRKARPKEEQAGQQDMIVSGVLGDGFSDPASGGSLDAAGVAVRIQWTANQVKDRRPGTYRDALDMLAAGMPIIRIARALHLAPETIRAIRADGMTLSHVKQRLGAIQLFASELAAEAVVEDLSNPETSAKIPTASKAIISGIMAQRGAELIGGQVTGSVSISVSMTAEQYAEERKRLMAESMGSGGREVTPKGASEPGAPTIYRAESGADSQAVDLP